MPWALCNTLYFVLYYLSLLHANNATTTVSFQTDHSTRGSDNSQGRPLRLPIWEQLKEEDEEVADESLHKSLKVRNADGTLKFFIKMSIANPELKTNNSRKENPKRFPKDSKLLKKKLYSTNNYEKNLLPTDMYCTCLSYAMINVTTCLSLSIYLSTSIYSIHIEYI